MALRVCGGVTGSLACWGPTLICELIHILWAVLVRTACGNVLWYDQIADCAYLLPRRSGERGASLDYSLSLCSQSAILA